MYSLEKLKITVLDNGFTVVTDCVPDFPLTAAAIVCRTGGYHDPQGKLGLAHYFEHMLSHSHPDKSQADYFQMVDRLAIKANLSTAANYIVAHAYGRGKSVLEFMDFVGPSFLSSAYGDNALEHDRGEIVDEVSRRELDVSIQRRRAQLQSLFGEHANPSLGFAGIPEHLAQITRDDIEGFRARHIVGSNMMFISAGGVSHEDAVVYCRQYFSDLDRGHCSQPVTASLNMRDLKYPIPHYQDKAAGIMLRFDANPVYENAREPAQLDLVELYLNSIMQDELRVNGGGGNGAKVEFSRICGYGSGLMSIDTSCAPQNYARLMVRMGEILDAVASGDQQYKGHFELAHERARNSLGEAAEFFKYDMVARRQFITDCALSGTGVLAMKKEQDDLARVSFDDAARIVRTICCERPALTVEHYGHVGPEQLSGVQILQSWQGQRLCLRAVA